MKAHLDDIRRMAMEITMAYLASNRIAPYQVAHLMREIYHAFVYMDHAGRDQDPSQPELLEAEARGGSAAAAASTRERDLGATGDPSTSASPAVLQPTGLPFGETRAVQERSGADAATRPSQPTPAVPVELSIQPDHIICLEDGKPCVMLRRYLSTKFNMTPDEYRRRWGLPDGYPMIAPNYREQKARRAKAAGLGKHVRPRTDSSSRSKS
jgi:predicted transcriptional regulator